MLASGATCGLAESAKPQAAKTHGVFPVMVLFNLLSKRPADLGPQGGKLRPCPNSPNCVSTFAMDELHRIEPFPFSDSPDAALARLKTAILLQPRVQIITATDRYLHAEFTTALLRFVDDVEFLIDPEQKVIHFRSASRIGYSDLGANRKRMEAIRRAFVARTQ
jgi:uncharacterized protein (DUF1499 family)